MKKRLKTMNGIIFPKETDIFVVSDVFGCYAELEKMLNYWNRENDVLIFTGNVLHYGDDAYRCYTEIRRLQKEYGAIVIRGEYEQELLHFVEALLKKGIDVLKEKKHMAHLVLHGGSNILESFNQAPYDQKDLERILAVDFKRNHAVALKKWILEMPHFVKTPTYFVTHAGADLRMKDLTKSSVEDLMNMPKFFLTQENYSGKKILFGAEYTADLRNSEDSSPYISACGTKIGLNCGVLNNRRLTAFSSCSVESIITTHRTERTIHYTLPE